jgi:hypothetical protein
VEVEHEPYSEPYYFSTERKTKIKGYLSMPVKSETRTFSGITAVLTRDLDDKNKRVFAKDMGYYVWNHGEQSGATPGRDIIADLTNSNATFAFLIRNPEKSIPSLDKMQKKMSETYGQDFQPEEVGITELCDMYLYMRDILNIPSIAVVDADDVINSPEKVLPIFCEKVGLKYDARCVHWNAETPKTWDSWAGWHDDAKNSSGFGVTTKLGTVADVQQSESEQQDTDRTKHVAAALEECRSAYETMWRDRIVC